MTEYVDSDLVDDCIQLLVHEYINSWSSYRRVFGNLSSPNLGRVEAIYAHKMHDVIIQILSSKGVVVKHISRLMVALLYLSSTHCVADYFLVDPTIPPKELYPPPPPQVRYAAPPAIEHVTLHT